MNRMIAIFFLLICFPCISSSEPLITSVTGVLADEGTVTVSGTGFGLQGPSIRIYDNFEGGVVGATPDLTAVVGNWFGYGSLAPKLDDIGFSGDLSMRVHNGDAATNERIIKAAFPDSREFFVSYWLQIPLGNTFPGTNLPGKIPTKAIPGVEAGGISTWKLVWIFDGDNESQDNDIALPTHVGGDLLLVGNNTREVGDRIRLVNPDVSNFDQTDSIFRFGEWVRFTIWMKAGVPETGPGNSRYTLDIPTALPSPVRRQNVSVDPVFSSPPYGAKPPYRWTHMNFTGFTGNGNPDWSLTRPLFDDVYLATGPGAQARIEICDQPIYNDCVRFGYVTVDPATVGTDWTDAEITGIIRKGALSDAEIENGAFIFVFDENNLVNPEGYPICGACPLPPTNFQVE